MKLLVQTSKPVILNFDHEQQNTLHQSIKMPPKKKVERAATENISLGPQVREGESTERHHEHTMANHCYR